MYFHLGDMGSFTKYRNSGGLVSTVGADPAPEALKSLYQLMKNHITPFTNSDALPALSMSVRENAFGGGIFLRVSLLK